MARSTYVALSHMKGVNHPPEDSHAHHRPSGGVDFSRGLHRSHELSRAADPHRDAMPRLEDPSTKINMLVTAVAETGPNRS